MAVQISAFPPSRWKIPRRSGTRTSCVGLLRYLHCGHNAYVASVVFYFSFSNISPISPSMHNDRSAISPGAAASPRFRQAYDASGFRYTACQKG